MFEPITKKQFIQLLKESKSELLFAKLSMNEEFCTKVMDKLYNGQFSVINPRTCAKSNSVKLTFSTGSNLHFDSVKKCYRHNNVIISYDEFWDSWDNCYRYGILAYVIE